MKATRLLDDSSLLLKWSVSEQVIDEMLQTSEDELPTNQAMIHMITMKTHLLLRLLLKRTKIHLLKYS